MQGERSQKPTDAARAWLEGVGGNLIVGEGKLKSVKVSKKGNRITLVLKRRKAGKQDQPTA